MEYVYFLANASHTLRVVKYLQAMPHIPVKFITVLHLVDGWVFLVKMDFPLSPQSEGDIKAFLTEMGILYSPPMRVRLALWSLEAGESAINVMRRYQVIVVRHGNPDSSEIEAFRHQFIEKLGYCPQTLA